MKNNGHEKAPSAPTLEAMKQNVNLLGKTSWISIPQ
jgi:hypothetical protein